MCVGQRDFFIIESSGLHRLWVVNSLMTLLCFYRIALLTFMNYVLCMQLLVNLCTFTFLCFSFTRSFSMILSIISIMKLQSLIFDIQYLLL
jgi:hypothetical protein